MKSPADGARPGKIMCDLAVTPALGGVCLADIAILCTAPELFGPIASDPTASRLIAMLTSPASEVWIR